MTQLTNPISNILIAMKKLLLLTLVLGFFTTSCSDLFDEGDVKKSYDGPSVVAFYPLQQTRSIAATPVTGVDIQLIGEQRTSDLTVSFAVSSTSTAVSGTHYTLSGTTATIAAGTSSVRVPINLVAGSLAAGEVKLVLELQGTSDVPPSENLKLATIFIRP